MLNLQIEAERKMKSRIVKDYFKHLYYALDKNDITL